MPAWRRVRSRGTDPGPPVSQRCLLNGVRPAHGKPRTNAVRTGRESDQERWVPELEGRLETLRRWGPAEGARSGADLVEIQPGQRKRSSGRRAGVRGMSHCPVRQDGAAAPLTRIVGGLSEWLGWGGGTGVATSVTRVGHLGRAGVGGGMGVRDLSADDLAARRPGRPRQQHRDQKHTQSKNHRDSGGPFSRGSLFDANASAGGPFQELKSGFGKVQLAR